MGDDDEGATVIRSEGVEQIKHQCGGVLVEVAAGFIGQQQAGIVRDGACERDPLALTATQGAWKMISAGGETDAIKDFECSGSTTSGRRRSDAEGHLDIFQRVQTLEEAEVLKHESHHLASIGSQVVAGQRADVDVADSHFAPLWPFKSPEERQQRRFSRTRATGDREVFSCLDLEIHASENVQFATVRPTKTVRNVSNRDSNAASKSRITFAPF